IQRRKMDIPILIGGATTSKLHTAVKLAPHYDGVVCHVSDASLVVGVCNHLHDKNKRLSFITELKNKQQKQLENFNAKNESLVSLDFARKNSFKVDWQKEDIPQPEDFKLHKFEFSLDEVLPFVDWSPFFWAWELKGKYPAIFNHAKYGEQAKELFDDAQGEIAKLKNLKLNTRALFKFWPAGSHADEVQLFNESGKCIEEMYFLRQQAEKVEGSSYYSLADFVAPIGYMKQDSLGMFVATAGDEIEKIAEDLKNKGDDYRSILLKVIADRLAEATTELLHKKVRAFWQYGKSEDLSVEDLIAEKYRGIRPAPGYPACPDHSEKDKIWQLLQVEKNLNVYLTESKMMTPPSSVCGFYFSCSQAKYFSVGSLGKDQLVDYARRKQMKTEEITKWI
ncbi:MAG: hypothetical protein KDD40_04670, partial [Bdellovibrionales bacterium]|nr:hypothetical protein [Bdellovibrionales bacterium]